jgi:ribosomal protein S18 acetylase RimI-like enzyme
MSTVIRPARRGDAAAVAAVRAAAAATLPADAGAAAGGEPGRADFEPLIEQPGRVQVAEQHGTIIGYVALRRAAHPAVAAGAPLQLWQLYVEPAFHGRGVAAQLMAAVLEQARRDRQDSVWLGVAPANARAVQFYRKHGFTALGLHEVGAAGHAHQDLLMARAIR